MQTYFNAYEAANEIGLEAYLGHRPDQAPAIVHEVVMAGKPYAGTLASDM